MDNIQRIVFEAIGEVSAVFMSKEERGVDIKMPEADLKRIGDELVRHIEKFYEE